MDSHHRIYKLKITLPVMEKEGKLLLVLSILSLFLITMIFVQNAGFQKTKIVGYATEETTISNVSIQKFLSIALSGNLSTGIIFGSINTLPATNENASFNYDVGSTNSSMFVNVSSDSNTAVDFCIKADYDLNNSADDKILLGNETYANNVTITNITQPDVADETALTTGYVETGTNIGIGSQSYFRFWLDVPSGQASGTYNNTVYFKGIETSTGC